MENFFATFKEKLSVPRNLAVFTAVIGLIIGLILAWGVFPVKWKDAAAEHLRADERVVYLRNAVNSYTMTGRKQEAQLAWNSLGNKALETLEQLNKEPGFLFQEQIISFTSAVDTTAPVVVDPGKDSGKDKEEQTPIIGLRPAEDTEVDQAPKKGKGLLVLGIALLLVLLVGAFLVYWFFFKDKKINLPFKRNGKEGSIFGNRFSAAKPTAAPIRHAQPQAKPPVIDEEIAEDFEEEEERPKPNLAGIFGIGGSAKVEEPTAAKPVAQFMTTYMLGDDMYDESFTFDAPNGEFLGECGVSSSDTIGVGEPKKVSAFDIWLFDKNDIQTVTKVVMSKHAFSDAGIRQRLEIRGEPILAEEGKQFVLETATLRLEAKLVNFNYGDLPLPENSYFQRATMELAIYRK